MKVVIDTNLLIDGQIDDYSYSNRIIDAVIEGKIKAFANRSTLRENILLTSQKVTDEDYLQKLENFFDKIEEAPFLEQRLNEVEDREDNKLLESAVAINADYLVTSDHHLLVLKEFSGTKIATPTEFWNNYSDETQDSWSNWIKQFLN